MRSSVSTRARWPVGILELPGFVVFAGMHPPASVLAHHSHDLPTICAVQRGSFTEYYAGKAVACRDGALKVTPAGEPHWNRFDDVTTFGLRIDVDPDRFSDQPAVRRILDERVFLTAGSLGSLTRQIVAELRSEDSVAPLAAEGLLLELVARMARMREAQDSVVPKWLRRADDVVHESYLLPLTVTLIAGEVGVNASTLSRGYRRAFGCTIARRIRTLRIEHAARRLAVGGDALCDIALEAGFYDQSHFTNAFHRQLGMPPAQYRRRHHAAG
jgi:AraC family transcriptional regulator